MSMPTPKPDEKTIQSYIKCLEERSALPFDDFVQWALYDPEIGYYQKKRKRVGSDQGTDFYTSRKLGRLWAELIISSCTKILGGEKLSEFSFVEIAAEPNQATLAGLDHPFVSLETIHLNDPIQIPDRAIVFSNEWLDAQPFKRFRYSAEKKCWQEIGVSLEGDKFKEIPIKQTNSIPPELPDEVQDGYTLDWPSGSLISLNSILGESKWNGLFLTFDYGLPRSTLLHDRPEGTARGYWKHQMITDILAQPGEQDITCHLCWDNLMESMNHHGFKNTTIQTQESFLLNHASQRIQEIFTNTKTGMNKEMQALRELIHPAHLGHGMQALWGTRLPESN